MLVNTLSVFTYCSKGGLQGTAGLGQGGPVLRNKNSPSILRQKNMSADPRSYVVNGAAVCVCMYECMVWYGMYVCMYVFMYVCIC